MASTKELRALITLAGKIDPSLQKAMLKASGESLKLSKNLNMAGKGMNNIGTIAKGTFLGSLAANAVSSLSSNIWNLGKESLKLASDLTEVQNVVDTTFGANADQINNWSEQALKSYGLAKLEAKQYSGTMGAMLKSSGVAQDAMLKMSQNLTALSGDFASFYNLNTDEAFEKIRSGISGETEPLKQLGINMSVANLEAYALSKGITTAYSNMDQASQTLLRYNYLMDVSKDAQGDFAKTQGNFANQQRLFDKTLRQASATIAEKALPYLTQFLQKANDFAMNADIAGAAATAGHWFTVMGDGIKWVYDHSNTLIPVLSGLLFTMTGLKALATYNLLMKAWKEGTIAATLAQRGLNLALISSPIGLVIVGMGLLVGAGVYLWKNLDMVKAKAAELWVNMKNSFADGVNYVIDKINYLISGLNKIPGVDIGLINHVGYSVTPAMYEAALNAEMYAGGGIAMRPSIFGEAGPEMAIPLERTPRSLGLLNQTAQILGAGGPAGGDTVNVTVNVYASDGNARSIASTVKDTIVEVIEEYFDGKARVSFG